MEKNFFEVFPALTVSDDDRQLLEETRVTKLVSSSRHDKLNIYLSSDHIIPRSSLYRMEGDIRRQYYKDAPVTVRIIEKFELAGAYTPKALFAHYESSILDEAARINPAWTDLLKHADFEFPESDDTIVLVLEDRPIARDMADEIAGLLDNMLNKRCGLSANITVSFKEREARKSVEHKKKRIMDRISQIEEDVPVYNLYENS